MCWRRSRLGEPVPPAMESDIFEHFALEVFRNLFAFDVPSITKATSRPFLEADDDFTEKPPSINKTMLHKVPGAGKHLNASVDNSYEMEKINNTQPIEKTDGASTNNVAATNGGSSHHRRNSTRNGVNSDLSKYGPWGYLMLGMLLCGGALLICGLWGKF